MKIFKTREEIVKGLKGMGKNKKLILYLLAFEAVILAGYYFSAPLREYTMVSLSRVIGLVGLSLPDHWMSMVS